MASFHYQRLEIQRKPGAVEQTALEGRLTLVARLSEPSGKLSPKRGSFESFEWECSYASHASFAGFDVFSDTCLPEHRRGAKSAEGERLFRRLAGRSSVAIQRR